MRSISITVRPIVKPSSPWASMYLIRLEGFPRTAPAIMTSSPTFLGHCEFFWRPARALRSLRQKSVPVGGPCIPIVGLVWTVQWSACWGSSPPTARWPTAGFRPRTAIHGRQNHGRPGAPFSVPHQSGGSWRSITCPGRHGRNLPAVFDRHCSGHRPLAVAIHIGTAAHHRRHHRRHHTRPTPRRQLRLHTRRIRFMSMLSCLL